VENRTCGSGTNRITNGYILRFYGRKVKSTPRPKRLMWSERPDERALRLFWITSFIDNESNAMIAHSLQLKASRERLPCHCASLQRSRSHYINSFRMSGNFL
jgi:hypothetical protein